MKKFFAGIIFLAFCSLVLPATDMRLTATDAVQMALENNISLKQAQISFNSLKRQKWTSYGGLIPSVNGSFTIHSPNEKPVAPLAYDYTLSAGVNISWTITPMMFTNIFQAKLSYDSGEISYEQATRSIELSVRQLFANLLYQSAYAEAQEKNLKLLEEQYRQASTLYRNGRTSELDMMSAQVRMETAKPSVLSARINYDNNLDQFKNLLGIPSDTNLLLDGDLSGIFAIKEIDFSSLSGKSLDVAAAEQSLKIAKFGLLAARINLYSPVIQLGWGYQPSATNETLDQDWKDGGSFSATISLSVDKFLPLSSYCQQVFSAKDNVRNAELNLSNTITNFQTQLSSSMRTIIQSRQAVESLKSSYELSEKTLEMTRIAYNSGVKDYLSLQSATDSRLQSEVALLQGALGLFVSILDYENKLNLPFGTISSLAVPAESN
ncbi:MAG: TolC family protein [Spirochaetaceae bacterium]|nr:TolC family protein [Spirochaetaceae bacterium]